LQVNNEFNRGDLVWQVEYKRKPLQYVITGPFEIVSLTIIQNAEGTEVVYTTNVGASNGLLKLTEKMKVYRTLEEAVEHVRDVLEEDKKEENNDKTDPVA
jgi:hypothetical protein